ncbi:hypothetical protein [Synoicihabitans lomoniglobus]|uniref:PEP-CTERM protein-sorting domain-containing protein n=1 Tax=Synoicihabitans lomoniglobus TaxID=2909285 RepID=A0AAF0CNB3_9BACT|nr:hypothetical protein [Opitutaceae bacterium LMO-M01]WED64371.1 hypothetical protein PXH66_18690 [Opitutaceae bacterium LMO-M01]
MKPTRFISTLPRVRPHPIAWVPTLLLAFAITAATTSAQSVVTIGDDLIDRTFTDGSSGGVYLYTGTFGQAGTASSWAFHTESAAGRYLTPLLFQKLDDSNFQVTGVGQWTYSESSGTHSDLTFNLIAGTDVVGADYTFGFTDRKTSYPGSGTAITTDSRQTGIIEAEADGLWAFTYGEDAFDGLSLGQIYQIGADLGGDETIVALYGLGLRTYSSQMSISAVPEPASAGLWIGGAVLVGFMTVRRRLRTPCSSTA